MTLASLSLLDKHSTTGFPPGYNPNSRTFYSPVDDVHGALVDLVSSASISLVIAMYGWDDDEIAQITTDKISTPNLFVQLSFDATQAAGTHEKALLARQNYPATSVAYGQSEKHAIMHMKMFIVDGLYLADGSTNLSESGETKQDNQLTIISDPVACVKARARADAIHTSMLQQMAAAAAKK